MNNFKKEIDSYKKNDSGSNFDDNRIRISLDQLRNFQIAVIESKKGFLI